MKATEIIDISRLLAEDTAVWPGDTTFEKKQMASFDRGDNVNLTTLRLSSHTATHVDAPSHMVANTATMEQMPLSIYWGPAQVVTVARAVGHLVPADFDAYDLSLAPRLLVRTPAGHVPYNVFPASIPIVSQELGDLLRASGVILYGTNVPSVDAYGSKIYPGHQALIGNGIAILENLELHGVDDGLYELCALPLKVVAGDGSPVRAALRRLSE